LSPAASTENFSEARDDAGSNLLQYALLLQTTVEQRQRTPMPPGAQGITHGHREPLR
jgi:hypothetical protein